MNKNQIEAYRHYRRLYPDALLLFHVGNQYVILFEDVKKVINQKNDIPLPKSVAYQDDDLDMISACGELGLVVKIISHRNASGNYDFPDIETLNKEQQQDY